MLDGNRTSNMVAFPRIFQIFYVPGAEVFIRKEFDLFCIEIRFPVLFTSSWRFNAMDIKRFSLMQFRYNLDIGFCENRSLIRGAANLQDRESGFRLMTFWGDVITNTWLFHPRINPKIEKVNILWLYFVISSMWLWISAYLVRIWEAYFFLS